MVRDVLAGNIKDITKDRLTRLTLGAVILLPLLYSCLYLWAFWNPYEHLKDLPVGIVNDDQGSDSGALIYGKVLVDGLLKSKTLNWKLMSQNTASLELKKGNIYFYLSIPKDFTEKMESVSSPNPSQASMKFVVRESSNVLMPQIGGRVVDQLKARYSAEATRKMVSILLDAGKGAAGGIGQAATGAKKIASGNKDLSSGAVRLTDGLSSAHEGAMKLTQGSTELSKGLDRLTLGVTSAKQGSHSLSNGLADVKDGVDKVAQGLSAGTNQVNASVESLTDASKGASSLASGAITVYEGSKQVSSGLQDLTQGLNMTDDGALKLADGLADAAAKLDKLSSSPLMKLLPDAKKMVADAHAAAEGAKQLHEAIAKAAQASKRLSEGSAKVTQGQSDIASGAKDLSDGLLSAPTKLKQLTYGLSGATEGLHKLSDGTMHLEVGANSLYSGLSSVEVGTKRLDEGSKVLVDGATTLSEGITTLYSGSRQLTLGAQRLSSGSQELAEKLTNGSKLVEGLSSSPSLLAQRAKVIAEPVTVVTQRVNPVDTYGTGFAPYFLSLSLWVGSLLMFFAVNIKNPGVKLSKSKKTTILYSKFILVGMFAIAQAMLSCGSVHLFLGAPVRHIILFYCVGIVSSITFAAIAYVLVASLGMVGRFVSLVLLMLQLTSCGGTFPPETIPTFFQKIKPWLPMTYTVSAFKGSISGYGVSEVHGALLFLIIIGSLFIALSPLSVKKDYESNELKPIGAAVLGKLKGSIAL